MNERTEIIIVNNIPEASAAVNRGIQQALTKLGMVLERAMKLKITSNIPPPLKPETIRRKRSSVALIDTGQLRSQIAADYGHIKENVISVGVFGSSIAAHHEFGAPRAGIPERSYIRSSLEEVKHLIPNIVQEEVRKEVEKAKIK